MSTAEVWITLFLLAASALLGVTIGYGMGYTDAERKAYLAVPPKVIYVDPVPGEPREWTVNGKEGRIIFRQRETK